MQKTTMQKHLVAKKNRIWYEIDASNVILGDLAVFVSNLLRGKNKPTFTPNVDCGDYVIVRNCKNVKLSGNKLENAKWYTHSQYIGGLKTKSAKEMLALYSDRLVKNAVKGMLPKNRLADSMIKKLFVYQDQGKDHASQKPTKIQVA